MKIQGKYVPNHQLAEVCVEMYCFEKLVDSWDCHAIMVRSKGVEFDLTQHHRSVGEKKRESVQKSFVAFSRNNENFIIFEYHGTSI